MSKARFVIAVVTSIIQLAAIVAILLWGLPRLGIIVPVWGIILVGLAFVIYAVTVYQIGSVILRKKALPGLTDMTGLQGKAISRLAPEGLVKISGEIWQARSEVGVIESGTRVVVVSQSGLKLLVRVLS